MRHTVSDLGSRAGRRGRIGVLAVLLLLAGGGSASAASYEATVGVYMTPGCADASSYFATGLTGQQGCSTFNGGNGWSISPDARTVGAGYTGQWQISAPAGLTITEAYIPSLQTMGLSSGHGWNAGGFWNGGSDVWSPTAGSASTGVSAISSSYYGFKLYCYSSSCPGFTGDVIDASVAVPTIDLTVEEDQGPGLVAVGSTNLWYQTGNYVWNPPGDPFSIELVASDPSGVCNMYATAGAVELYDTPSTPNVSDGFQQCPSPVDWTPGQDAEVDTDQIVPVGSSGSFPLQLDATNAAGVTSTVSETIEVDQVQPTVTLSAPNDSNPGGWSVNHAVTVDAAPHTGASGVSSLTCSVDGGAAKGYPSGGVSVNGNGKHVVTCTVANQAVDPQGAHNTGSSSMTIDIDEQSPSLSFDPQDPSNAAQVVVNTSDNESQVADGQIEIAPHGTTNWTQVPTTFASNGQLIATIPDAGLSGPYTIQATACSQVGNCGTTSETLTMPLRVSASSDVSFSTIVDRLVAKKVKERVRVGWHWAAVLRHGQAVKVKRGGHHKTITVIRYVESCTHRRKRTGKHKWTMQKTCRQPHVTLRGNERVAFGKRVTVNGLLLSSQGVPLTNVPVKIMTAPNNGLGQYTQAATVTTNAAGAWSTTLPAGPSRIIQAVYGGSATLLPATGQATVAVPARVRIKITPRAVRWGSEIRITGQVLGGYVPTNSNLLRLNVGIGRIGQIEGLPDIHPNGDFVIIWKFNPGRGVVHPWFSVATLAESAFPYSRASSNRVAVTLGKRAAHHHHRRTKHRRTAKKRKTNGAHRPARLHHKTKRTKRAKRR